MASTYAQTASIAMDPIEKKPLYHFFPGSEILSLGTWGCNLSCSFCQNYVLSQETPPTQELLPEDAVRLAKGRGSVGIAYTYNEPTIWFEYVRDTGKAIRQAGLKNVLVTNGFIEPAPLQDLLLVTDAANIDIKAFTDDFYREVCGGRLAPVLEAAKLYAANCHVEITHLVIPGRNDDPVEQEELASWIKSELGESTPVHLSAYTPRYKLQAEPTSLELLEATHERFHRHLKYVYLGNVHTEEGGSTRCPNCQTLVIERQGFAIAARALGNLGCCAECGEPLNIVT
jgi:pyruvate formate lyase activating enzyme